VTESMFSFAGPVFIQLGSSLSPRRPPSLSRIVPAYLFLFLFFRYVFTCGVFLFFSGSAFFFSVFVTFAGLIVSSSCQCFCLCALQLFTFSNLAEARFVFPLAASTVVYPAPTFARLICICTFRFRIVVRAEGFFFF